jgi:MYXO-CTERM domain-containing protein
MMKMSTFFAVSTAVACACSSAVMADIVWDESVDGSLSTDRFSTTDLGALSIGSNDVIGTTVSGISKFFTITIAEGTELSALIVEGWESADDIGFLGVVDGDWFDVDPANPDVTQLLGYAHYGELDLGQDILPTIGTGPGSQGFTGPLGPGDYSFWVRQGGADAATWDLNFVVTPAPGALALLGLGGLFGTSRRRS